MCAVNAAASPLQSEGLTTTATTLNYGHLIFVSDTTTDGDFDYGRNDLSGGDQICQADAVAAGLSGTFLAILSRTGINASSRFSVSADVKNSNGEIVTLMGNDLFGGSINSPVRYGPTGIDYDSQNVWTNSDQTGSLAGGNGCYNFNSNDPGDSMA